MDTNLTVTDRAVTDRTQQEVIMGQLSPLQPLYDLLAACKGLRDSVNIATITFVGCPTANLTVGQLKAVISAFENATFENTVYKAGMPGVSRSDRSRNEPISH